MALHYWASGRRHRFGVTYRYCTFGEITPLLQRGVAQRTGGTFLKLYIGVDGGGTKTEVLTFDESTHALFVSKGTASNPSTMGWDNAVMTVDSLIQEGIKGLNGRPEHLAGLSLCMAGVDRPEQVESLKLVFARKYPRVKVEVANDGLAALTAGTRGASGVVVIAGTGSITVGESWDGETARAGGYGSLIGDEGSGFDIGRRGLMAAIQYAEGRGDRTMLWERAAEVFSIHQPGEIIPKIYNSNHPVGTVASFARHVLEASVGDDLAMQIVDHSTSQHLRMIKSIRNQLKENVSNQVVLAGGLFTNTSVLRDSLEAKLKMEFPELSCAPVTLRPSAGAVLRAMRLVHSDLAARGKSDTPHPLIQAFEDALTQLDGAAGRNEFPVGGRGSA
jgi:N-acetylglucosamine kinase-like BadF-type ATPase